MKSETLSLKTMTNELDFLRKTVIQWNAWKKKRKDLLFLANKLIDKIPDPCNAKVQSQSIIRKKSTKSVKKSQIITYQPKTFENPNIFDRKSIITEHAKTSPKLSKTIKQAEKIDSNSCVYSDTKRVKIL